MLKSMFRWSCSQNDLDDLQDTSFLAACSMANCDKDSLPHDSRFWDMRSLNLLHTSIVILTPDSGDLKLPPLHMKTPPCLVVFSSSGSSSSKKEGFITKPDSSSIRGSIAAVIRSSISAKSETTFRLARRGNTNLKSVTENGWVPPTW